MDIRNRTQMGVQTAARSGTRAEIDAGLREYFRYIYNQMVIGLSITGLVAYFVANNETASYYVFETTFGTVAMFAPMLFLFFGLTPRRIQMMSLGAAQVMFWVFSGLMGLCLASIFLIYTGDSIARVFFITAAMFAGMSLYGYTTKKDLTGMGQFLMMGMFGLLLAVIVNIFMQSAMLHFVTSAIGVVIFTGMIAWDTQNLKAMYYGIANRDSAYKVGLMGAISLYMNVILLFEYLMHFMGRTE